jgi:hypothetical protein
LLADSGQGGREGGRERERELKNLYMDNERYRTVTAWEGREDSIAVVQ